MIDSNIINSAISSGAGSIQSAFTAVVPLQFGATTSVPQIVITSNVGTPFLSGANVVVPITITITAKYVNDNGVVYRIQELNEDLTIGYEGTTIPSSVTNVVNASVQTLRKTKCCKSYELLVQGTFTTTIV